MDSSATAAPAEVNFVAAESPKFQQLSTSLSNLQQKALKAKDLMISHLRETQPSALQAGGRRRAAKGPKTQAPTPKSEALFPPMTVALPLGIAALVLGPCEAGSSVRIRLALGEKASKDRSMVIRQLLAPVANRLGVGGGGIDAGRLGRQLLSRPAGHQMDPVKALGYE